MKRGGKREKDGWGFSQREKTKLNVNSDVKKKDNY